MMGGIPTKVTGQALTVNEQGEDVVIPGLFAVGEMPAYRSTAPTVWAATRSTWWSLAARRSASAGVHRRAGQLRDASESDIEGSLDVSTAGTVTVR
jgi:succinate dehydrogenase / fumarate reductase flavoprotein subunit